MANRRHALETDDQLRMIRIRQRTADQPAVAALWHQRDIVAMAVAHHIGHLARRRGTGDGQRLGAAMAWPVDAIALHVVGLGQQPALAQ